MKQNLLNKALNFLVAFLRHVWQLWLEEMVVKWMLDYWLCIDLLQRSHIKVKILPQKQQSVNPLILSIIRRHFLALLHRQRIINWASRQCAIMFSVNTNALSGSTKKSAQTSFPRIPWSLCIIDYQCSRKLSFSRSSVVSWLWKTIIHGQKYWSNYSDSL